MISPPWGGICQNRDFSEAETPLIRPIRLTGATNTSATASYQYDARERRIRKIVNATTQWHIWSGDRLLAEYSASGSPLVRYVYGSGFAPVSQLSGPTPTAATSETVYADQLETPRALSNLQQTVVWQAACSAFGEASADEDPDGDGTSVAHQVRFSGQYFDAETGVQSNWFRHYEASLARYLSADPIDQPRANFAIAGQVSAYSSLDSMSVSLYQYARNRPMDFIDVNGLVPFTNLTPVPIRVSGNPGPGDGEGDQEDFDVYPGQTVDADHPVSTERGP